jgi:hypothetical protein
MSAFVPEATDSIGQETCILLRSLARKTARDGVAFCVDPVGVMLSTTVSSTTTTVSARCWSEAIEQQWIVADPSTGSVKISAKGRARLRQLLSQSQSVLPLASPLVARARHTQAKPQINNRECPVAWLSTRRDKDGQPMISAEQLAAAERLRGDFWFAGMSPRVTTNWAEPSSPNARSADGMRDHVVAASERVRLALHAVGPEMASLLIDVCCHLKGLERVEEAERWPQRSARIVLSMALTQLARHYGLIAAPRRSSAGRIEHWGAAGYRPMTARGNGA